jgi:hypothetical protein
MSSTPWLRRAELSVGPLLEWQSNQLQSGPSNKQAILNVVSDGTQDTLRMSFNIRLHAGYVAPASTITIYNLAANTRAALLSQGAAVILRVGWENQEVTELFSGSLLTATSSRQGPDVITTIMAISSYANLDNNYVGASGYAGATIGTAWHFEPGTSLKTVIIILAANLVGPELVDPKLIDVPDFNVGWRGLTVNGKIFEYLNDLSRIHGFTWWLDNGAFNAVTDNKVPQRTAVLLSAKNGMLLHAEPLLVSGFQRFGGLSFRSLLYPAVKQGSVVQIDSLLNPRVNGTWFIQEVVHHGDTQGDDWYTDGQTAVYSNALS